MINLDTCSKASDTIKPLTPWCDTFPKAIEMAHIVRARIGKLVLEKGLHFGKWQWRYCERIPAELVETFNENPLAYAFDRAVLGRLHKFLKKEGENEST
jgi:hypothetical protein